MDILLAASKTTSSKSSQEKVYQPDQHQNYLSNFDVQLFDTSGSMGSQLEDKTKKIDILSSIFTQLPYCPQNYSFDSQVKQISYASKLVASGGTNLALALDTIKIHRPHKILVVSDGMPDSENDCFLATAKLNCSISCFYIGLDSDEKAKQFLRKLAADYNGKYEDCDISSLVERRKLPQKIQNLLPES